MPFWLPFGCDPAVQKFLRWPKAYELSYQSMIPHKLDLSVDALTWEIDFGSVNCYQLASV